MIFILFFIGMLSIAFFSLILGKIKKSKGFRDFGIIFTLLGIYGLIMCTIGYNDAEDKKTVYTENIASVSKVEIADKYMVYGHYFVIETEDGKRYKTQVNDGYLFDTEFSYGDNYISYTKSHNKKYLFVDHIYVTEEIAEQSDIRIYEYSPSKAIVTNTASVHTDTDGN